jgi:hypothetical protein
MAFDVRPRTVSWRTASGNFGSVHFIQSATAAIPTLCGLTPPNDRSIDWNPPLSAETICKTCEERFRKPLKLEK